MYGLGDRHQLYREFRGPDFGRFVYHQFALDARHATKKRGRTPSSNSSIFFSDSPLSRPESVHLKRSWSQQHRLEVHPLDSIMFREECLPRYRVLQGWASQNLRFSRARIAKQVDFWRGDSDGEPAALKSSSPALSFEAAYPALEGFASCPNRYWLLRETFFQQQIEEAISLTVTVTNSSESDSTPALSVVHPAFRALPPKEVPWNDYLPLNRVDLVKVDVEGHYEGVFQGGFFTMQYFKPIVLYEHEGRGGSRSLEEELGYSCVRMPATLNDDRVCLWDGEGAILDG